MNKFLWYDNDKKRYCLAEYSFAADPNSLWADRPELPMAWEAIGNEQWKLISGVQDENRQLPDPPTQFD